MGMNRMKAISCLLAFLIIFSCIAGCVVQDGRIKEICSSYGYSSGYTVTLYQIGDAAWPFGPATGKLVLTDAKGKVLNTKDISVSNDGGNISGGNYLGAQWFDDYVEVTILNGEPKETDVYKLYFSGKA